MVTLLVGTTVELISDLFEDVNLLADIWPRLRDLNTTGRYHCGVDL